MKSNRKFKLDRREDSGMIAMLPTIAFAIIILFAVMYIGSFINGTIASALVQTYETNEATGHHNLEHWNNATLISTNTSHNVTLSCQAGDLYGATSRWSIVSNATATTYNLSVNGVKVNDTSNLSSGAGFNWTLTALIAASAVTSTDTWLNYTWNMTSPGKRIYIRTHGDYLQSGDYRTDFQNRTVNTLGNLSVNFDSTLDIVVVAVIIVVLTIPLMAVVAIKRLL